MDKMNENMNGPIFSHEPPRLSTATSIQDDRGDDNEDDDDEHTDGNDEHEHENEYYDDEDTDGTDDDDDDDVFLQAIAGNSLLKHVAAVGIPRLAVIQLLRLFCRLCDCCYGGC